MPASLTDNTTERLDVVYLGHTAALSGAELGLARLISASPRVRAHVILAEDGALVDELEKAGATVEVLPLGPEILHIRRADLASPTTAMKAVGSVLSYTRRLEGRLRSLNPSLIHSNSLKAGVYGVFAARMARLPIIWGLHDRIASDYLPTLAVGPTRLLVRTAPTALIGPSRATLDAVGGWYRPGLKRAVIPLPLPISQLGTDYSVRDSVACVGLIGRLAAWKGQDVFLRAFAQAFPTGPTRARIVGSALFDEGEYGDALPGLSRALGIADRVEFVGFSSDVPGELAKMDILVNSSILPETLGQTIIEAMGAGVPTVSPRAGGPLEYVNDNVSGLLHEPGNVDSLAGALKRLDADVSLRRQVSQAGRLVATSFSPEPMSARMFGFYREVLKL